MSDRTYLLPLTPAQIAAAGIDSFLEYRDQYGYDEDVARAKAINEVAEGEAAAAELRSLDETSPVDAAQAVEEEKG